MSCARIPAAPACGAADLGQITEFARRGDGKWSVSSIADRTVYPAPGLLGGQAGATGEVALGDGTRLHAKALVDLKPDDVVHVKLPGGGGYGDSFKRDPAKVLWDVVEGYITPETAERNYGVKVVYRGNDQDLVKMPEKWFIDQDKTTKIRASARTGEASDFEPESKALRF